MVLTPEAAQTLGMVLTELALNAVEHGALSSATGEVQLSWGFPNDATIEISWHETGGPPFVSDGAKGYGTSVVERFFYARTEAFRSHRRRHPWLYMGLEWPPRQYRRPSREAAVIWVLWPALCSVITVAAS